MCPFLNNIAPEKAKLNVRHQYLCIEGNIGTGKTALASRIAKDFGKKLLLEEFEDNSFLPKFYEDPARYAFPLEMSFLASRFNQLNRELLQGDLFDSGVVSDYVFFKCLVFSKITLSDDEYDLYTRLFDIINLQVPQPGLLVYLHKPVSKLQEQIQKRGRSYEQKITDEYLLKLQEAYFDYINHHTKSPVLILDTTSADFVNSQADYDFLINKINAEYPDGVNVVY